MKYLCSSIYNVPANDSAGKRSSAGASGACVFVNKNALFFECLLEQPLNGGARAPRVQTRGRSGKFIDAARRALTCRRHTRAGSREALPNVCRGFVVSGVC